MKKIFSKVAILTLGVALAAGAGVALSAHKEAMGVSATEVQSQRLDFTAKSAANTTYGAEWEYGSYKVFGGANNNGAWAYVAFGAKKQKASDADKVTNAYIKSPVMTDDISKVSFDVVTDRKQNGTVTSTLEVYSNSDFSTLVDTVDIGTIDQKTAGTHEFTPTSGTSWGTDKYFKLNLVCTNSTTSNGMISLSGVSFFKNVEDEDLESISIENVGTMYLGQTHQLVVVPNPQGASLPNDLQYVSSKTNVATVSATGLVTAVATGTTTITVTSAADASITASVDVTVANYPLQGLTIGKTYVLINAAGTHELNGINTSGTNHYGNAFEYTDEPANKYTVDVESGLYTGSVAFKVADGYLKWTSGNTLDVQADVDANSSWVVERVNEIIDEVEGTYYKVTNLATYGGNSERVLRYNTGSPRFACYQGGQTPVDFFEVGGVTPAEEADTFAQALLDSMTCNDDGASAPTTVVAWATIAGQYEALSQDAKDIFAAAEADAEGSKVEEALARYEMVVAKYGYDDFMNRDVAPAGNVTTVDNGFNTTALIIVVAAIALTSVAGIVTVIIIRRRRFHN